MKRVIVTGNGGLVGGEAAEHFYDQGYIVYGIDNNARKTFFGDDGDTSKSLKSLLERCPGMLQLEGVSIIDRQRILSVLEYVKPDVVVHCAAQPSHDWAARDPFMDFDTNVVGTHNMLEATRLYAPEAVFIHMSTNKVYGDAPNIIPMVELEKRYDYDLDKLTTHHEEHFGKGWSKHGISEDFTIDQSTHSVFGADKAAGDLLVQEYGRYFGMKTCCLRGGCLTGTRHSGAELHGFLAYFFKAAKENRKYTIFGYKGKQVRDQIHSRDIAAFMDEFIKAPRCGEVYNLGGGKDNSASILECIDRVQQMGFKLDYTYSETARRGDHIAYFSDLRKMKAHYPNWDIRVSLDDIFEEFAAASRK
jgi:CDP-paratose 2-epimerase